ncbi:hypothetical protein V6N12_067783 [Hibiscus sabdariffa]|uniref:Uncharacterized protein n=1 Tax=Hibiscus sabdariffa TaxID=183260 RepID=A0ABR2FND4_9ROSI
MHVGHVLDLSVVVHVGQLNLGFSVIAIANSPEISTRATVQVTDNLEDSTVFPSLYDYVKKNGRDQSDIIGSGNKFVVLSVEDDTIPEGRKAGAASQGVTNILIELKAKKKEKVEKSKRSSVLSKVVDLILSSLNL